MDQDNITVDLSGLVPAFAEGLKIAPELQGQAQALPTGPVLGTPQGGPESRPAAPQDAQKPQDPGVKPTVSDYPGNSPAFRKALSDWVQRKAQYDALSKDVPGMELKAERDTTVGIEPPAIESDKGETLRILESSTRDLISPVTATYNAVVARPLDLGEINTIEDRRKNEPKTTGGQIASDAVSIIALELAMRRFGVKLGARYPAVDKILKATSNSRVKEFLSASVRGTIAAEIATADQENIIRGLIANNPSVDAGVREWIKGGAMEGDWDQKVGKTLIDLVEGAGFDLALTGVSTGLFAAVKKIKPEIWKKASGYHGPEVDAAVKQVTEAVEGAPTPKPPEVTPAQNAFNMTFNPTAEWADIGLTGNSVISHLPTKKNADIVTDFKDAFNSWVKDRNANPEDYPAFMYFFISEKNNLYSGEEKVNLAKWLIGKGATVPDKVIEQLNDLAFDTLAKKKAGGTAFFEIALGGVETPNMSLRRLGQLQEQGYGGRESAVSRGEVPSPSFADLPETEATKIISPEKLKAMRDVAGDTANAVDILLNDHRGDLLSLAEQAGGTVGPLTETGTRARASLEVTETELVEGAENVWDRGRVIMRRGRELREAKVGEKVAKGEMTPTVAAETMTWDWANFPMPEGYEEIQELILKNPEKTESIVRVIQKGRAAKSLIGANLLEITEHPKVKRFIEEGIPLDPQNPEDARIIRDMFDLTNAARRLEASTILAIERLKTGADIVTKPLPWVDAAFTKTELQTARRLLSEDGAQGFRKNLLNAMLIVDPSITERVKSQLMSIPGGREKIAEITSAASADKIQPFYQMIANAFIGQGGRDDFVKRIIAETVDPTNANQFTLVDSYIDALSGRWGGDKPKFAEYFVETQTTFFKDGVAVPEGTPGAAPRKQYKLTADPRTVADEVPIDSLAEAEEIAIARGIKDRVIDANDVAEYADKLKFLRLASKSVASQGKALTAEELGELSQMTFRPADSGQSAISAAIGHGTMMALGGVAAAKMVTYNISKAIWNTLVNLPTDLFTTGQLKNMTPADQARARVTLYKAHHGKESIKSRISAGIRAAYSDQQTITDSLIAANMPQAQVVLLEGMDSAIAAADNLGKFGFFRTLRDWGVAARDAVGKNVIKSVEFAALQLKYRDEILENMASGILEKNPAMTVEAAFAEATRSYDAIVRNNRAASATSAYRKIWTDINTDAATKSLPQPDKARIAEDRFKAIRSEVDMEMLGKTHTDIISRFEADSVTAKSSRFSKAGFFEKGPARALVNMAEFIGQAAVSPFAAVWTMFKPDAFAGMRNTVIGDLSSPNKALRNRARAASGAVAGFYGYITYQAAQDNPYEGEVGINPPLPENKQLAKQMADAGYIPGAIRYHGKQFDLLPEHLKSIYISLWPHARRVAKTGEDPFGEDGALLDRVLTDLYKGLLRYRGDPLSTLDRLIDADPLDKQGIGGTMLQQAASLIIPAYAAGSNVADTVVDFSRFMSESPDKPLTAEQYKAQRSGKTAGLEDLFPPIRARAQTSLGQRRAGGQMEFGGAVVADLDQESPVYKLALNGIKLPEISAFASVPVSGGQATLDLRSDKGVNDFYNTPDSAYDNAFDHLLDLMSGKKLFVNNDFIVGTDPKELGGDAEETDLKGALNKALILDKTQGSTQEKVNKLVAAFQRFALEDLAEQNPSFKQARLAPDRRGGR